MWAWFCKFWKFPFTKINTSNPISNCVGLFRKVWHDFNFTIMWINYFSNLCGMVASRTENCARTVKIYRWSLTIKSRFWLTCFQCPHISLSGLSANAKQNTQIITNKVPPFPARRSFETYNKSNLFTKRLIEMFSFGLLNTFLQYWLTSFSKPVVIMFLLITE